MDRREHVFLDDLFVDQNRIFVVVAIPRHERDEHVTAQRQFAVLGGRSIGNDVTLGHDVAHRHQRTLVDASRLVGALELHQRVDIDAGFAGLDILGGANDDTAGIDLIDDPAALGADGCARIARNRAFHTGADERRFSFDQRHGLPLHVRTHQRAVGVIVFQERNQRCCHRNQLLGRHIGQGNLVLWRHQKLAGFTGRHEIFGEAAVRIDASVGLRDGVARLFHGRQIHDFVGQPRVDHLAVRRFDEAIFVDPAKGGQAVDQADVRAFRRFNRADAAIVRRVNVAHFKAGALAGQTARPERRHTALVGDFRQRIGLIHELAELTGAKKLAHSGHGRLGVNQVIGHHRVDIDTAHALLHSALHAQQANPVLIFEQFADRAHAAVAEIVDIVDFALAVLQLDQCLDHGGDVLAAQHGDIVRAVQIEAHVHLDAANCRQIVAVRIKKQAKEHGFGSFARWRFTRAHDAVNFRQRMVTLFDLVGHQRVANPRANLNMIDIEQFDAGLAGAVDPLQIFSGQLVTGFDVDFAGGFVDEIEGRITAIDFLGRDQQGRHAIGGGLAHHARRDLGALREDDFASVGVHHVENRLGIAPAGFDERHNPARLAGRAVAAHPHYPVVKQVEHFFGIPTQRIHQAGHRQLALAIDADIDDVLGVEFEIQPAAAIRNDPRCKQIFARRMRLAAIMIEKHARRPVHLADDHALGAVDNKGTIAGHQRHVTHVHVLLLDIEHGAGFAVLVHFKHDQAQRDAHRRCIGHAALAALVDVVFWLFQFIMHEIKLGSAGEIADRKHRTQRLFEARNITGGRIGAQKLLIALALHLDQVGHLHDFADLAKALADAAAAVEDFHASWRLHLSGHV